MSDGSTSQPSQPTTPATYMNAAPVQQPKRQQALDKSREAWKDEPSITELPSQAIGAQLDRLFSLFEVVKENSARPVLDEEHCQSIRGALERPTGAADPRRTMKVANCLAKLCISQTKGQIVAIGLNLQSAALQVIVADNQDVGERTKQFLYDIMQLLQNGSHEFARVHQMHGKSAEKDRGSLMTAEFDKNLSRLVLGHSWERLRFRIEKWFTTFHEIVKPHVDEEATEIAKDQIKDVGVLSNLIGILSSVQEFLEKTKAPYLKTSDDDIETVLDMLYFLYDDIKNLQRSGVYMKWAAGQGLGLFSVNRYLTELAGFQEDITLLNRLARSPKYTKLLAKPIKIISLPAANVRSLCYPMLLDEDAQSWNYTVDLMIKAVNDNLRPNEYPWEKDENTISQMIQNLKVAVHPADLYSDEFDEVEKQLKIDAKAEVQAGREKCTTPAEIAAYLGQRTSDRIDSKTLVTDRVHCELKVIDHILSLKDPSWFTGIGVSKLCCSACYITIHALHVTGYQFYVRNSYSRTYHNGKYPDFATLSEQQKKEVARITHLEISRDLIFHFPGLSKKLPLDYFESDNEGHPTALEDEKPRLMSARQERNELWKAKIMAEILKELEADEHLSYI